MVKKRFSEFITAAEWTVSSPDLNPMDNAVLGYLTQKVSTKNYANLDAVKKALFEEWDNIDTQYQRAMVDSYPKQLRVVIKAREERFENC